MNVLLNDPGRAPVDQVARMNRFWGDGTWRNVAYEPSRQTNFFEDEVVKVDDANQKIAEAYRRRLIDVAGFKYAPTPLPFVNSLGRTLYYLYFASPNATGGKIVEDIFSKYRQIQGQ
jgi:three-Cys-motif partner protein